MISMAKCKTAVTPVLTHWSYCSLALSHRSVLHAAVINIFSQDLVSCGKYCIDHSEYGLSQSQTSLQCDVISHWLRPYPKWSLYRYLFCLMSIEIINSLRPKHNGCHFTNMKMSFSNSISLMKNFVFCLLSCASARLHSVYRSEFVLSDDMVETIFVSHC